MELGEFFSWVYPSPLVVVSYLVETSNHTSKDGLGHTRKVLNVSSVISQQTHQLSYFSNSLCCPLFKTNNRLDILGISTITFL